MFAVEIQNNNTSEAERHAGESYCAGCRTWYSNGSWIHKDGENFAQYSDVTVRNLYADGSDPDSEFVEVFHLGLGPYTSERIYECPSCFVLVEELNEAEVDEYVNTHLCGCCGSGYGNVDSANECCSHMSNPQPNPDVFRQATRED